MKAYKAFNDDLTCIDFQYEIGKTYTMNEKPIPCKQGFHACLDLEDVFGYYDPIDKIRICKVELNGDIIHHEDKVVTNSITILEEIDYKSTFNINDFNEHFQMMAAWYIDVEDLTDFVNHPNEMLRSVIASRGYDPHLEVLVHDENEYVRLEVARHGRDKDLDILVHDPSAEVRVAVAEQGRVTDLDILVHDTDDNVRMTVVEHGRPQDLDILVNDSSHYVRKEVARHGRPQDLEILIHDEDPYVRRVAIAMFEKLKTERIN